MMKEKMTVQEMKELCIQSGCNGSRAEVGIFAKINGYKLCTKQKDHVITATYQKSN